MSLAIIPEIVLLDVLKKGINFIRTDYENAADKSKTWLSLTFNGIVIERYNVLEQLVSILCTEVDHPRYFDGDIMFNHKREHLPSFYITLPSESMADGNSIGMGQTAELDIYEDTVVDQSIVSTSLIEVYGRRMQTNYNIVIVSDNSMEVVVLYHFMRALLVGCYMNLVNAGLQNISFAGQDIQPYRELVPQLYMRGISLNIQYNTNAPATTSHIFFNDVVTAGKPTE